MHPDWPTLLKDDWARWQEAAASASSGPLILIATNTGGFLPGTQIESLLAVALTLRGAQVHFLLCDEALPACLQATIKNAPDELLVSHGPAAQLCRTCFRPAHDMYRSLGLPVHRFSEFLTPAERTAARQQAADISIEAIPNFQLDGIAVGEHAFAGTLRYYVRGDLAGEPLGETMLRRYFEAALLTSSMMGRLVQELPLAGVCLHHGIYVPQGLVGEVARRHNIHVVNHIPAYRKQCLIFSHHTPYQHAMVEEPASTWENLPWTQTMQDELMSYLGSRWQGTQDWFGFHERPEAGADANLQALGLDPLKPCIGLLSNVMWDAQLFYRANAFPNMRQWVIDTIRYFAERPELQLLIRIHPAEVRGTLVSRQRLADEIWQAFPVLPSNVFVIPPESPVSTYALMERCNTALIYGTKMGIELTSMGIPVIVAGEAWVRGKGITLDADSAEAYYGLLNQLPLAARLSDEIVQRARKYAYHFFFRLMIPVGLLEPAAGWPPFQVRLNGLDDLAPGRSRGLDIICDGILNGTEFVYPAEDYLTADRPAFTGRAVPAALPTS